MIQNSTNLYSTCAFIVDNTPGSGNYSTIADAISAAVLSTYTGPILIKPGTYTENLTMVAGVNLTAYVGGEEEIVYIDGTLTFDSIGTYSVSNLTISSPTRACVDISGEDECFVNMKNVSIIANNIGVSFTNSNALSSLTISNSEITSTFDISLLFDFNSPGTISINSCSLYNPEQLDFYTISVAVGAFNMHYSYSEYRASASSGSISYSFSDIVIDDESNDHVMNISGSGSGSYHDCRINMVQSTAACCALFLEDTASLGFMVGNYIENHGTNIVGVTLLETPTLYTSSNGVIPTAATPVAAGIVTVGLVAF